MTYSIINLTRVYVNNLIHMFIYSFYKIYTCQSNNDLKMSVFSYFF